MEVVWLQTITTILLFGAFCPTKVKSYNILMSADFGAGSHYISIANIGEELVKRGHNVTFLIGAAFEFRKDQKPWGKLFNFEVVQHTLPHQEIFNKFNQYGTFFFHSPYSQRTAYEKIIAKLYVDDCGSVFRDVDLSKRLAEAKYDVIVFNTIWICSALIAQKLEIPSVGVATGNWIQQLFPLAGIPINPSYMPAIATGFSNRMTFIERLINAYHIWMLYYGHGLPFLSIESYRRVKEKYNIRPDVKTISEVLHDVDIWLAGTDPVLDFPLPLSPNVIQVGGLTVRPTSPLPQELEDFMASSAEHGVILFTMGTYFTDIDPDVIKIFTEAFSEIDQKVVWHLAEKVRSNLTFDLPRNVMALPWIPQNDLLGHEKTRLMISHGGSNGVHEALYHGVPLVAIPIISDQYDTGTKVLQRGIGLKIDKFQLSKERILSSLGEILSNSRYKKTAVKLSAIFKDRPLRPTQRAAFWIEHVIKHGGRYMASTIHNLNVFQLYLLDVVAFLLLISLLFSYVIYRLLLILSRCVRNLILKGPKEKAL